jgi:hypothetical protein
MIMNMTEEQLADGVEALAEELSKAAIIHLIPKGTVLGVRHFDIGLRSSYLFPVTMENQHLVVADAIYKAAHHVARDRKAQESASRLEKDQLEHMIESVLAPARLCLSSITTSDFWNSLTPIQTILLKRCIQIIEEDRGFSAIS